MFGLTAGVRMVAMRSRPTLACLHCDCVARMSQEFCRWLKNVKSRILKKRNLKKKKMSIKKNIEKKRKKKKKKNL